MWWLASSLAYADPEVPPEVETRWRGAARVSRAGLGVMIAGGGVRLVGTGLSAASLGVPELAPAVGPVALAGGTAIGLGAVAVASGALSARAALPREARGSALVGVLALPVALAGTATTWAQVIAEAAGAEPLPYPSLWSYGAVLGAPLAFVAAQQISKRAAEAGLSPLPERHPLLELSVAPLPGGGMVVGLRG